VFYFKIQTKDIRSSNNKEEGGGGGGIEVYLILFSRKVEKQLYINKYLLPSSSINQIN